MKYQLKDRQGEVAIYTPGVPAALTRYEVPSAHKAFHASGDYGIQLFQQIEGETFEAWCMHFEAKRSVILYSQADSRVLALHFALKNSFHYSLNGIGEILLPQRRFNLTYAPELIGSLKLEENRHYRYFEVHPRLTLLEELAETFPVLQQFLSHVASGRPTMLKKEHCTATPEMLAIIHSMLYNRFEGDLKKLYLETKAFELMLLSLYELSQASALPTPVTLTAYDIERLHQAKSYLLENMDSPSSIAALARMVGINESKLKRGFKQVHGTTIFDFVIDVRMEKAKDLLLGRDTPIKDIAIKTGYSKTSNFTVAFKKKFGKPPSAFRKGFAGD